jgi:hypothetical protein
MSGWRREGCRIVASPDLNTPFPASANFFALMAKGQRARTNLGHGNRAQRPGTGNIHAFLGSMGISGLPVIPSQLRVQTSNRHGGEQSQA